MRAALCVAFLLGEPLALPNADDARTRFTGGQFGFEHWLFECPKCDQVETRVIASDPFKSKTAGWLAGELGRPN
jgi:hypothetical protein